MTEPPPISESPWTTAGPLLDAVGDVVCGLDSELRIAWVNQAAVRVAASFGIDAHATMGQRLTDALPFPADSRLIAALDEAPRTGETISLALPLPFSEREVRVRVVPVPWGVAVVARERIDRRTVERAHGAYEARYRTLLNAVPLPLVLYHRETSRILAANRAMHEQLSIGSDLVGRLVSELAHEDEPARYAQEREPERSERKARGLWRLRGGDGRVIEAEVTTYDLAFDDQPARMALLRDVTAARRSEAERLLLREAIARINDLLVITSAVPDADGNLPIVFVNEAFERHTGWNRDEVMGMSGTMLDGPATDPAVIARVHDQLRRGEEVRAELQHYTRDGREYWVELVIVPVTDANGLRTHWVAVHRDISDRKMLEEQLFQSQKMEAVGRLAGGVAHDFNNVLTAISGFSELLLEELPAGEGPHEEVLQILAAAARATALTRQLLAFSRKQIMRPQAVDLGVLVTDMERLLQRVATEEISIRITVAERISPVLADPVQLEQVLLNLAVNGSEAMPAGGVLSIAVSDVALGESYAQGHHGVQPGHYVCLVVTDSGVGMDRTTRERIFEPFFTTKKGGTGLGLSTVYGIVSQSGGHVWVHSESGVGSTFKIYLPVATGELPLGESTDIGAAVLGGHETVLVVEDEALVREVTRAMLQRRGYRVLVANDGDHALRVAESHYGIIDLLLTDVVMPRANGRRVAEQLRMLRPNVRVLYMSGYTDDAIVHHGVLEPGISLLEKPFTELALARAVRERLDAPAADPLPGATR